MFIKRILFLLVGLLMGGSFLLAQQFRPLTSEEITFVTEKEATQPMRVYLITDPSDSLLLRTPSRLVQADSTDEALQHFIDRLYQTVTDSASLGVGIAAPQVGVLRQIIWVQRFDKEGFPFEVYLNPRIIEYSTDVQVGAEGCLSIPDRREMVSRAKTIQIEYDTRDGEHKIESISDFTAVIFQHEIDHLNGILYPDHIQQELADAGQALAKADGYWQQAVKYQMEIDLDVNTHRFDGKQALTYFNNSPDTLTRVFYHLYFNAFRPGSMMDIRTQELTNPDRRMTTKIGTLKEEEVGQQRIHSLLQDGIETQFQEVGTILEVELASPLLPGDSSVFQMEFDGQVPVRIRRAGRNNEEGIAYTMTQWYPKLCEYDQEGWHATPYIGREFHGVWGDFDVKLTLDSSYIVGASGYLQNPLEVGHGYENPGEVVNRPDSDRLTWHFIAPKVHDFAWGADPDYVHLRQQVPNGPELHYLVQDKDYLEKWKIAQDFTAKMFVLMAESVGPYPYDQYSIVQGGDGGMEYAMLTMITGDRSQRSLEGVIA
ncbi:MAG: peptide deformylase, partial [Bacteroidota bacterium]